MALRLYRARPRDPAGRLLLLTGLLAICGSARPGAAAAGSVPLTVRCVGAAQVNAPVFTGVPFPPGALRDVNQLNLVSSGVAVPRQVRMLSTYPDGSLRVVL